ncbi:MAG: hypothetical protein AAF564_25985, partial [Bacteroidota bacterium]
MRRPALASFFYALLLLLDSSQAMAQQTVFFPFNNHFDDIRGQVFAEIENVGGVTFVGGHVANAADFSGSSQRLNSSDSFFHGLTGFSFEMVGWVRLDALAQNHGLFGQTTSSYHCHVISTNKVRWRVNTAGGPVILDSATTLTADVWARVRVGYDHVAGVIFLQINDGTVETKTTGGSAIQTGTQDFSWGSITTSNYMNGKQELFMMRREGLFTTTELDDHYNSGAGQAFKSEIELDYDAGVNCTRQRIQAKAAQIGGTGAQECYELVIDHTVLTSLLHDSDNLLSAESAGAGSLRLSTDSAGANMLPCKIKAFTPASGGGKVEIYTRDPADLDADNGSDFYIWAMPAGHSKSQPPASHVYGAQAAFPDSAVLALVDNDYTDATSNANNGTATGVAISSEAPFGVESFQFDGVSSRIVIPDDNSLDLTGDLFVRLWFYVDSDTGTFQGLFNKRLATTNNYSMAFEVLNNLGFNYVNAGQFRGATVDFATHFGLGTWFSVSGEMSGSTFTEIFKNATSIGSASTGGDHPVNSESFIVGNIENGAGIFNQFPFHGKIKGLTVYNTRPSSDIKTTLDNNQKSNTAFWDSSFAVVSPGGSAVTSIVAFDAGLSFAAVAQKKALAVASHGSGGEAVTRAQKTAAAVITHDAGPDYAARAAKAALALIGYDAGQAYNTTGQKGASALTGVLAHAAGFTSSATHKSSRAGRASHEAGQTYSNAGQKGALAPAGVTAYASGFTYSNTHTAMRAGQAAHNAGQAGSLLTSKASIALLAHAAGFTY